MRRVAGFLVAALFAPLQPVAACTDAAAPSFQDVLARSESVAIVFVESVEVKDKTPHGIGLVRFAGSRAGVRVVETLIGEPAKVRRIDYIEGWCDGLHVDPGQYYVVLLRDNAADVSLERGEPAVLKLFEGRSMYDYDESLKAEENRSPLLRELRNYVRLGRFLQEFPIDRYIAYESPRYIPIP